MSDTVQLVMEAFKDLTSWLAAGTELAAALVISLATLKAVLRALLLFVHHSARTANASDHGGHDAKVEIRLKLVRWLVLALEFELAADILRTAVAPTWTEIVNPARRGVNSGSLIPRVRASL